MSGIPAFVWLALLGAFLQGFAFALSRQLLVYSDNRMQVAFYSLLAPATLAFLFAPTTDLSGMTRAPGLILGFGASVAGSQLLLMEAMKRADASFVTPLLGLKVFFVTIAAALLWQETHGPLVYVGAVGTFVSLFFLNDATFRAAPVSLLFTLAAALLFGCNDIFVMLMLQAGFTVQELVVYSMLAPLLILGPLGMIQSRGSFGMSWRYFRALSGYGLVQIGALLALTGAFAIGRQVTLVVIIQNLRGVFGLLAVYLLAIAGLQGIERLTRRQYLIRAFGSMLMAISVTLAIVGS